MLQKYQPESSLYFGHRYKMPDISKGYMAGGSYILSRKALEIFVEQIIPNDVCRSEYCGDEDLEMGRCLQNSTVFMDTRDEYNQKRFFPIGIEAHFKPEIDSTLWYFQINFYAFIGQGSLECCSDKIIAMHYIKPSEMYYLEYLIYHVYPFGI